MNKYTPESNADKIDQNNPYRDDLLSDGAWVQLATSLFDLFSNDSDSMVLSIEAPWGSGKTHFLRRLPAFLQKNKNPKDLRVISINAWESDYLADPFEVLIYRFTEAFPRTTKSKDFLRKAEIVTKNLLIGATNKAFEKFVGFEIGTEEIMKQVDEKAPFEDRLRRFREFEDAKVELFAIIGAILEKSGGTCVVIVDELDRCHPHYAIEFLERVKHFFAIPRIKFIFGIDYDQLCHLAKGAFGAELDAINYLNRFFSVRIQLPVKSKGAESLIISQFENILGIGNDNFHLSQEILPLCNLIDGFSLTPRQKILMTNKMALAFRYIRSIQSREAIVVALALFLEEKSQGILTRIFASRRSEGKIIHEVVEVFMKQTRQDDSDSPISMDKFCIPEFFAVLFGRDQVSAEIASWQNKQLYLELTRGTDNNRLITWHKQLSDHSIQLSKKDKGVVARATSLASLFRF